MFYCIYSDSDLDDSEKTLEHVIPLSLGGCNSFAIDVGKKKNNEYGSSIEGAFSKQMLSGFYRLGSNSKGHSKKIPAVIMKGKNNDRPSLFSVTKENGLKAFDCMSKRNVLPGKVVMNGTIEPKIWICLIAKITLAAGYFLYKKDFNTFADCHALRKIADSAKADSATYENLDVYMQLVFAKTRPEDQKRVDYYKNIFKEIKSSGISFEYVQDRLISYIGINGNYIGAINIKCNNKNLPKNQDIVRTWMICCQGQYVQQDMTKEDFEE